MGSIEYDVFVSKNSLDQNLADSLVDFLESNGLRIFESSRVLPELRDSDYQRAIFEALDKSASVIVICSENENGVSSKWVNEEWSWYLNEMLSGRKSGQIMTMRKGIEIKNLDIQLRKYESFDYDEDFSRLLKYVKPKAVKQDDTQLCELHFGTDSPCDIYQFGNHVGHLDPDKDFYLKLRPGKYKFEFVCSVSKETRYSVVHSISGIGSDYLEIKLKKAGAQPDRNDSAPVVERILQKHESISISKGRSSVMLQNVGNDRNGVMSVLMEGLGFRRGYADALLKVVPCTILDNVTLTSAHSVIQALAGVGASAFCPQDHGLRSTKSSLLRIGLVPGHYSLLLKNAGEDPDAVIGVLHYRLGYERSEAERLVNSSPVTVVADVSLNTISPLLTALEKEGALVEYFDSDKETF